MGAKFRLSLQSDQISGEIWHSTARFKQYRWHSKKIMEIEAAGYGFGCVSWSGCGTSFVLATSVLRMG